MGYHLVRPLCENSFTPLLREYPLFPCSSFRREPFSFASNQRRTLFSPLFGETFLFFPSRRELLFFPRFEENSYTLHIEENSCTRGPRGNCLLYVPKLSSEPAGTENFFLLEVWQKFLKQSKRLSLVFYFFEYFQ